MTKGEEFDLATFNPRAIARLRERFGSMSDRTNKRMQKEHELAEFAMNSAATSLNDGEPVKIDGRTARKTGRTEPLSVKTKPEVKSALATIAAHFNKSQIDVIERLIMAELKLIEGKA